MDELYNKFHHQKPEGSVNTENKQDECREALLPCQCGGEAMRCYGSMETYAANKEKRQPIGPYRVECRVCHITTPDDMNADKIWNRRQPQAKALTVEQIDGVLAKVTLLHPGLRAKLSQAIHAAIYGEES